jgi:dCTP deaminase
MILSDSRIRKAIEIGEVEIKPMAPDAIGPNSIDLHLSKHIEIVSENHRAVGLPWLDDHERWHIDTRLQMVEHENGVEISEQGILLRPGQLYLGSTVEWTSCGPYAPMLEGTSGAGRLGISVHQTAGVGDVGFAGYWTLELTVVYPTLVFGGEPICQLILHEVSGTVEKPYGHGRETSYSNRDPWPRQSQMWKKPRFLG